MTACEGVFGKVFGHRFRGRYSEAKTWPGHMTKVLGWHPEDIKEYRRTYHHDICERCGMTIKDKSS